MKSALLLDSDPVFSASLRAAAKEAGCALAVAKTESEAVDALRDWIFPVVIVCADSCQAEAEGFIKFVRAQRPDAYVCLISQASMPARHEAQIFMRKPFSFSALARLVARAANEGSS